MTLFASMTGEGGQHGSGSGGMGDNGDAIPKRKRDGRRALLRQRLIRNAESGQDRKDHDVDRSYHYPTLNYDDDETERQDLYVPDTQAQTSSAYQQAAYPAASAPAQLAPNPAFPQHYATAPQQPAPALWNHVSPGYQQQQYSQHYFQQPVTYNGHAQQGYYQTPNSFATTAYQPAMSYPHGNSQYNYAQGYSNAYAQQGQQSYNPTPPAIRNPFPAPPPAHNAYAAQNASFDPEQEALVAQWQSQYAPADAQPAKDARGKADAANSTQIGPRPGGASFTEAKNDQGDKKVTVIRKGGGQTWEDRSLLEWDPNQFRIMVGNLAGEVTDDSLAKAFAEYGVSKARVIRDKRTNKSKGYGFVAFTDGDLGFKAARAMVGKYIGSHPVTIQRSKTDLKPVVQKDKYKGKGKGKYNNNNNKDRDNKKEKKQDDPLRANTGAVIEKKPVKNPGGYKVIG